MIGLLSPQQIEQNRLDCKEWLAKRGASFHQCSVLFPLREKFGNYRFYYDIPSIVVERFEDELTEFLEIEIVVED